MYRITCDTIRNVYLVFVPASWHMVSKALTVPRVLRVSFVC